MFDFGLPSLGFLLWLVLAVAVAVFAGKKGRSGLGWFFLSIIFSPLIVGVVLYFMEPIPE